MATRAGALIGRMGALAVADCRCDVGHGPIFPSRAHQGADREPDRVRRVAADRTLLSPGGRDAFAASCGIFRYVSGSPWSSSRVGAQAFATVLFTQALSYAFPAHAAPDFNVENEVYLLYMLQPVFGIAMARIFLKERRKPYFWPLAACAIVGVYLIVFPQNPLAPFSSVQHGQFLAAMLILGAVVLWASGTVFGRYSLSNVSFVTTAAMRFTLALPVLLILMLTGVGGGHLGTFSVHQIPSFIGIALIPGLLAMLLYYRALASTPASMASIAELGVSVHAFPGLLAAGSGGPRPAALWDRDRRRPAADRGGDDAQPAQAPRRRRDAAPDRGRPWPPKVGA